MSRKPFQPGDGCPPVEFNPDFLPADFALCATPGALVPRQNRLTLPVGPCTAPPPIPPIHIDPVDLPCALGVITVTESTEQGPAITSPKLIVTFHPNATCTGFEFDTVLQMPCIPNYTLTVPAVTRAGSSPSLMIARVTDVCDITDTLTLDIPCYPLNFAVVSTLTRSDVGNPTLAATFEKIDCENTRLNLNTVIPCYPNTFKSLGQADIINESGTPTRSYTETAILNPTDMPPAPPLDFYLQAVLIKRSCEIIELQYKLKIPCMPFELDPKDPDPPVVIDKYEKPKVIVKIARKADECKYEIKTEMNTPAGTTLTQEVYKNLRFEDGCLRCEKMSLEFFDGRLVNSTELGTIDIFCGQECAV